MRRRRGFTVTEALVATAVAAVVGVGAALVLRSAVASQTDLRDTVTNASQVRQTVETASRYLRAAAPEVTCAIEATDPTCRYVSTSGQALVYASPTAACWLVPADIITDTTRQDLAANMTLVELATVPIPGSPVSTLTMFRHDPSGWGSLPPEQVCTSPDTRSVNVGDARQSGTVLADTPILRYFADDGSEISTDGGTADAATLSRMRVVQISASAATASAQNRPGKQQTVSLDVALPGRLFAADTEVTS